MHQVHLSDNLYEQARRRAQESGFTDVDEYIAEVVASDLEEIDVTQLFTPERLARLDRISAEVKAGSRTYTEEELDTHFSDKWAKEDAAN